MYKDSQKLHAMCCAVFSFCWLGQDNIYDCQRSIDKHNLLW